MNVSFILHFCLDKYNFSLDTFRIFFVFWRRLTFYSIFISGLQNATSVSILFDIHVIFQRFSGIVGRCCFSICSRWKIIFAKVARRKLYAIDRFCCWDFCRKNYGICLMVLNSIRALIYYKTNWLWSYTRRCIYIYIYIYICVCVCVCVWRLGTGNFLRIHALSQPEFILLITFWKKSLTTSILNFL